MASPKPGKTGAPQYKAVKAKQGPVAHKSVGVKNATPSHRSSSNVGKTRARVQVKPGAATGGNMATRYVNTNMVNEAKRFGGRLVGEKKAQDYNPMQGTHSQRAKAGHGGGPGRKAK